ncbi:MAG: hypothetical protein IKZ86_12530 [Spirochaetaceae bacterium]|nr:hypothetical protein [Spirochaetaceae bacterium]
MSGGKRVLITFIIASLVCAAFALTARFGLLSVIENKFYKPMVYRQLEERNDLLSETVGKYIDTQDALFTLFAANPEIRSVTQKEQDELMLKSRANLASGLLTETQGLEGLRIIGENGKTIYYSTFPQDFAARKADEPATYRNYPKNDIPFESIAASEETKSRILNDSDSNRLIFSYPFYDNEMAFIGTIAFYVNAPSMLRYFIPTDRLSAQSGIFLWSAPKDGIHGFVFSVPEGLENVCKNAAVSSWTSSQKIFAFEDTETVSRAKYLLVSAENKNGYVSTVFSENILYMPERISNIILLATISLIFFISFICCIAKNAVEKHAEMPLHAKEDKKLAEEAASEVSIRAEEPKKDESLIEKIDDVFEMLAAESLQTENSEKTEEAEEAPQFDYDSQQFDDALFDDSFENTDAQTEQLNTPDMSDLIEETEPLSEPLPVLQMQTEIAEQLEEVHFEQSETAEVAQDTEAETETAQGADAELAQAQATESAQAEAETAQPLSTAAFLSAIDERMHQRQEIIEEYTQPVPKPHLEEPETDEPVATTIDENFEIEIPQFDADFDILENAEPAQPETRHGLLSAGNAILAEEQQKKEQIQQEEKKEQPQQEIKSAPLRKSSLSSIFKEKITQNQPYVEKHGGHSALHSFVQQTAPSTELTDISQHGLLYRGDDYRSNLPQKPALYTLDLKNSRRNTQTEIQSTQSAVEQQKEKKMDTSLYDETLEELQPAVETETITSVFSLQSAPQLFAAFANKEPEQRGSFERKGIVDRIVESTNAKTPPAFTETEHKIDNIHIENGVYRIHEEKDSSTNVKINYDFKRLVDSVLNG